MFVKETAVIGIDMMGPRIDMMAAGIDMMGSGKDMIGPDKRKKLGLNCTCFLINQFKHLFGLLKRTISLRLFF